MIKKEWKNLKKKPLLIIVMAAIILIPSIYSTLFLASMWDPYGQLDHLPVAVVNLDQPVNYKNQQLEIGNELVDNLKENRELDFHFVDADHAKDGIYDGTYYMVITIPEDFSKNAATLMDEHPKQMELAYATNPGTNYIASKLSHSALEKIESKISDEVTRTYAKTVFDQLSDIEGGLLDGADGADQMTDGTNKLIKGNQKLVDNLSVLADSTLILKNGSKSLSDGSHALAAGALDLNHGISEYVDGVHQLQDGVNQLSGLTKIDQVYDGIHTMKVAVSDGTDENPSLQSATRQLANGLNQMDEQVAGILGGTQKLQAAMSGMQSVVTGLNQSSDAMSQAATLMNSTSETLNQQIDTANAKIEKVSDLSDQALHQIEKILSTPSLDEDSREALEKVAATLKESKNIEIHHISAGDSASQMKEMSANLSAGAKKMASSISQLPQNIDFSVMNTLSSQIHVAAVAAETISNGTNAVAQGLVSMEKATGAFPQAAKGIERLMVGFDTLTANDQRLLNGAKQLADGSSDLKAGAGALNDGTRKINDGAHQLAEGSLQVQDGLNELKDGSKELSGALTDGAKEIHENQASDDMLDMFATPVTSSETQVSNVPDNGSAMSAYMMCVGLWVGTLAFCLMYPLTSYEGKLKSGFSWWLSKASVAYPMAVSMAVVMFLALHHFCGFSPVATGKTVLIACVAACCFMSIMYFFNVALGKVGSFLMLIFMVIQLAGSAGTYPIELSAGFVEKIHRFLPFSYVVEAFRMGICGEGSIEHAIMILICWMIIFTVLTVGLFIYRGKKIKEGKACLYDKLEHAGLA